MLKDIAAAQRSSPRKEEEVVRYAAVVKEIADVTIAAMEWVYIDSTWVSESDIHISNNKNTLPLLGQRTISTVPLW